MSDFYEKIKVVKDKYSGDEYFFCKNFPKCNGSIIDFMQKVLK
jgi:hypothetical protein